MGQTRTIVGIVFALAALVSPFFFPLFATVILTLLGAMASPAIPLAVGILLDALYWDPSISLFPYATLVGGVASAVALLVHRYVRTSIMYP